MEMSVQRTTNSNKFHVDSLSKSVPYWFSTCEAIYISPIFLAGESNSLASLSARPVP